MADIKYTMPPPTEDVEQMCLFRWADAQSGKYPELSLMYHIPNGGKRGKAEAGRFRAMGVKSGVPDIFLPVGVQKIDSVDRGQYCSATRPGINANTKSETTDPDTQTSTITVSPMADGTIKAHTADDATPATLNGWYTSVTLPTDAT